MVHLGEAVLGGEAPDQALQRGEGDLHRPAAGAADQVVVAGEAGAVVRLAVGGADEPTEGVEECPGTKVFGT